MPEPTLQELHILVAEREALLRPLERLIRCEGITSEAEIALNVARLCLVVGAERWRRVHPELSEEDAARIFGAMAVEAVQGFNDAQVIMSARRGLPEGKTHA